MITKSAMDIGHLRNFISKKVAPKFIRYSRNGRGIRHPEEFAYHTPRTVGAVTNKTHLDVNMAAIDKYIKNNPEVPVSADDIAAHMQGVSGTLTRMGLGKDPVKPHIQWGRTGHRLLRRAVPAKPVGKVENSAFNDIIAHHENNEFGAGKLLTKSLKKKNEATSFASHFHPDVVLKEHNLLSTLSGAPTENLNNVRNTFRSLRDFTGETPFLDQYIPGGFATGPRMNRRYRKFLSDKIMNDIG